MNAIKSCRDFASHNGGPGEGERAAVSTRAALKLWRLPGRGTLVVVSPHPGDETLGAGGIIHDLAARGWRVRVLAVTDGEAAEGREDAAAVRAPSRARRLEPARALAVLAPRAELMPMRLPDGEIARFAPALEAALGSLATAASLLLATWRSDGHPDREVVGAVAARVAAEHGLPLAEFPVWGWHWSAPSNWPVARARAWRMSEAAREAKREALAALAAPLAATERDPALLLHVLERFLQPVEVVLL